jgi:hypothetical protein
MFIVSSFHSSEQLGKCTLLAFKSRRQKHGVQQYKFHKLDIILHYNSTQGYSYINNLV